MNLLDIIKREIEKLREIKENKGSLPIVQLTVRTTIPEGATDDEGNEVPPGV
mgnify:CR=1 FL=1